MKDLSKQILSDIISYMKYAKYLPEKNRRETWEEIVTRNIDMHIKKYPELEKEIKEAYKLVYDKKVLPSMRSLQFAGKPIEINPARLYNCSAMAMDHPLAFSEAMFLLLSGCGVGYSVQKNHIRKLPHIIKPYIPTDGRKRKKRYLIPDSIEGWADAIKILMKSYFEGSKEIEFDYRDIRAKGERLLTSGGKAPGPEPLKMVINNIRRVLDSAIEDRGDKTKLKSIEVHDIMCHIADAVLSGGIRRAAMISLFSFDDEDMLTSKFGNWWELNPQRARSNNSIVLLRHKIKEEDFKNLWEKIKASGSGEPGLFFSNDKNVLTNPCFTGDMKILTSKGYERLDKLNGLTNLELVNKDGDVISGKVWENGEKEIIQLNLNNKDIIKCTPNHIFLTINNEEIEAKDLKNKRIKRFYKIREENNEYVKYGFIQGDGVLSRLKSKEHKGLEVNIGYKDYDIAKLFDIEFIESKRSYYVTGYNDILKNLKFSENILPDRSLPKSITTWNKENILSFLRGLFSANGCVIKKHKISFKSTSFKLIEELENLLKIFNIDSYYTTNKRKKVKFHNGIYECKESYDLNISKFNSIKIFAEKIGFVHNYKNKDLENLLNLKSSLVTKISSIGKEKVYDFSLKSENHWGVIEGYIAHNCGEISLKSNSFCNLTEINVSNIESQEDLNERAKVASFIGTLQAGYSNFHYLRDVWAENTEKEGLIGVSMTGIGSGEILNYNLKEASEVVKKENLRVAKLIGIKEAYRCNTIKPSGTSSLILGCSSGIHAWHSPYYIRRLRVGKNESIYTYLSIYHPELLEDEFFKPNEQSIISIPIKAPEKAILRTESEIDTLERVKKFNIEWIRTGHRIGSNFHNVSCTISVKDWDKVGEWMWNNRDYYNGISVLPFDGGTYKQTPFEECTKEEYDILYQKLKEIDLRNIIELEDNNGAKESIACSGGACSITHL